MATKIEWTRGDDGSPGETWNPVTGCDRVSPGCDNCYALTMSARLKAMGQPKYQTDGRPETSGPGFGVQTHPDTLDEPLRWRKPRRVFVNSMSDLFHPQVPESFIAHVFAVMGRAHQHTFQVLTKRPKRMRTVLSSSKFWLGVAMATDAMRIHHDRSVGVDRPLPNVWLGVSVEDQERAGQRIPLLLDTPAAVRFVSAEPLLGPVNLSGWIGRYRCAHDGASNPYNAAENDPKYGHPLGCWQCGSPSSLHRLPDPLDWVIVGGESGPHARLMHPAWAHGLVRQCQQAGVAVFVKQLGSHFGRDHHNLDAFPADLQVRQYPDEVEVPA